MSIAVPPAPRTRHHQTRPLSSAHGPAHPSVFGPPGPTGTLPVETVQIVSGSYGAGHDAAADQIAARFESRGYRVQRLDVVDLFPVGLGRILRAAYFRQLRAVPGSWDWLLRHLEADGPFRRAVTSLVARTVSGHLGHAVADEDVAPVLVVSTHPFASQALGHLRAAGELAIPVATYLTDMSVHPLWVHPGVDLHLALHELPAAEARRRGAGRTVVVGPLASFDHDLQRSRAPQPVDRDALRATLGLPVAIALALVTGGSQGIGELEHAAADIARTGLAMPVVLCGTNETLRARLDASPGVVALGWRDDVADLLTAVDCVVQNAGGFTSLEALAAGVPTFSYRCLPGHGQTNARALHDAGWAPWATTHDDLAPVLGQVLARGAQRVHPAWDHHTAADVVDVLTALLPAGSRLAVSA